MPTILLVEDEANQRLLYQMELEDEGYEVVFACNGREALQEAQRARPDLVVLDLRMPDMDGLEALQRLMALNQKLPVIIHSAYETHKDNFMTRAADAYVVKSSNVDVLKAEIRQVLARLSSEGRRPVWGDSRRQAESLS